MWLHWQVRVDGGASCCKGVPAVRKKGAACRSLILLWFLFGGQFCGVSQTSCLRLDASLVLCASATACPAGHFCLLVCAGS